jgi:putative hydrolase of the HAD superfamily
MPLDAVAAVVFDVGNTLHHLDHALIAAAVTRHGRPATAADVARAECAAKQAVDAAFRARRAGNDVVRRGLYFEVVLARLGVEDGTASAVYAELAAEDARQSLWRVVADDTMAVIGTLRARGFTLAVVSNADGRVAASLEASGLAQHFVTIIDSHVVGVEKPDPRIFAHALEACRVAAEEAAYVGDIYEIDVRGARDVGMLPVLIDAIGGYETVDCPRIERLAELLQLLPARAARRAAPLDGAVRRSG